MTFGAWRFSALLAAALSLALPAPGGVEIGADPAPPTVVVLVRHAEKSYRNRDSDLSGVGRKRAEALAAELLPLAPVALYASSMKRTQQTLAPLAASLHLPVTVRAIGDEEAVAAEILARHRGGLVVVCGHSETLTRFVSALGWEGTFPVVQTFDRIWTVTVPSSGDDVSLSERGQGFGRR